jgi:hypothetical protein
MSGKNAIEGLKTNKSIKHVKLSIDMTKYEICAELANMIRVNTTMTSLCVYTIGAGTSMINQKGVELIINALRDNKHITSCSGFLICLNNSQIAIVNQYCERNKQFSL